MPYTITSGWKAQDLLERGVQLGKVGGATPAVAHLPAPRAGRVQERLEPARIGVRLLDPLALRERIAEHHHPPSRRRGLGPSSASRKRSELYWNSTAQGARRATASRRTGAIHRYRSRVVLVAQVDVEIAARVRRIAVEQRAPLGVHDARRVAEALRLVAHQPQARFDEDEGRRRASRPRGRPCPPPSARRGPLTPRTGRAARDPRARPRRQPHQRPCPPSRASARGRAQQRRVRRSEDARREERRRSRPGRRWRRRRGQAVSRSPRRTASGTGHSRYCALSAPYATWKASSTPSALVSARQRRRPREDRPPESRRERREEPPSRG